MRLRRLKRREIAVTRGTKAAARQAVDITSGLPLPRAQQPYFSPAQQHERGTDNGADEQHDWFGCGGCERNHMEANERAGDANERS